VRIQAECVCTLTDHTTGMSDTYVLGVRTQTGLRTDPPSDALDPGYDFWMTFSAHHVYVKRNHASFHTNNPTRVPVDAFIETGWHLNQANALPVEEASVILDALQRGERLTARTHFASSDETRSWTIEYPIKWADADPVKHAFRVETGPVLVIDPEQATPAAPLSFSDFTWTYLDYHDFDSVRCLMEQPTSILTGATYPASPATPRLYPPLDDETIGELNAWLFRNPDAPISSAELGILLQTNHYSAVGVRAAQTRIFSLDR
jgi:hypothetical protein